MQNILNVWSEKLTNSFGDFMKLENIVLEKFGNLLNTNPSNICIF